MAVSASTLRGAATRALFVLGWTAATAAACSPPANPDGPVTDATTDGAVDPDAMVDPDGAGPDGGGLEGGGSDAPSPSHTALVEVRDLTVDGTTPASHISIRRGDSASLLRPGRCAFFEEATAGAAPNIPTPMFMGLMRAVMCAPAEREYGISQVRCVPTGDMGLMVPGSPLIAGFELTGPPADLKVQLADTGDVSRLMATVVPPMTAVTITEPASLPVEFFRDLTVRWTPLGHTRVVIELELGDLAGGPRATVSCNAAEDGTIVIPARMVMPPNPFRLSVMQYVEARAGDPTTGQLVVLAERGSAIGRR